MSTSKHTEAAIIAALTQVEAGCRAEDLTREQGVSKHAIYAWKAKCGGIDVTDRTTYYLSLFHADRPHTTLCKGHDGNARLRDAYQERKPLLWIANLPSSSAKLLNIQLGVAKLEA